MTQDSALHNVRNINSHPRHSQSGPQRTRRAHECSVCLGEHEEDIHAATVSVHEWFRGEVTKSFVVPLVC